MTTGVGAELSSTEDPFFWDRLLGLVEEGKVVPVVGPDLLTVEKDGRPTLLYPLLAERLAQMLGVTLKRLPPTGALHKVACKYMEDGGHHDDVYPALSRVLKSVEPLPIPEPLRKLACITSLRLFVTTTIDPLLVRALDNARKERTLSVGYSLPTFDLDRPLAEIDESVVFHLFGQISTFPIYAVTEEDMLEAFNKLAGPGRPGFLLNELKSRQILLIGNQFPDWLARFFLRIARDERLWVARDRTDVVADERLARSFRLFLGRFSARTRLFQGGPVKFVDELAMRWGIKDGEESAAPPPTPSTADAVDGAVFINYAHEDSLEVEKLCRELEAADIDFWLDHEQIEGGDQIEDKIRRAIAKSSLFVPVLSTNVLTPQRRFFRLEWELAAKEASKTLRGQRFVVPIVLEGFKDVSLSLPGFIHAVHWLPVRPGEPNPKLVEILTQGIRDYRRANGLST